MLGCGVKITIFVDANHASNEKDHRSSIMGMIIFIGNSPYKWYSKCQKSTKSSTFGAGFAAMWVAVDEAIHLINLLRSIGVPINGPVCILGDNHGVIDNSTIPGSALRKKTVSIAYHCVRESIATGLIEIYHVDTSNNVADILTKPNISSSKYLDHLSKFMIGTGLLRSAENTQPYSKEE